MAEQKYTDPERKRFQKTNIAFETNPYVLTQDPVIAGFKLMFNFYSPLLDLQDDNKNCAYNYLLSINEITRASYLKKFIELLKFLQNDMPWYFQSIDGLDEAWKRDFNSPKVHGELMINCLEDVTFKMTALVDLYRKACFDFTNMREIVPRNLRKFDLAVYVFDGRIINTIGKTSTDPTTGNELQKTVVNSITNKFGGGASSVDNSLSEGKITTNDKSLPIEEKTHVLFDFHKCELLLESGNSVFASLSNSEFTAPMQQIKIEYHRVEEANLYSIFGDIKVADIINGNLILQSLDISSTDGNTTSDPQGQIQRGFLSNIGESIENKAKPKSLIANAQSIANLDIETTATNFATRLTNNIIDKTKTRLANTILDAIGKNSQSLNNDTIDLSNSPGNINNNSASLTNKTDIPTGNTTDIFNSPSKTNNTSPTSGNVYE